MNIRFVLTSLILSVSLFVGVVLCSFVRSAASGTQVQYVTYADYDARSCFVDVIDDHDGSIIYDNIKLYVLVSDGYEGYDYYTASPILDFCIFSSSSSSLSNFRNHPVPDNTDSSYFLYNERYDVAFRSDGTLTNVFVDNIYWTQVELKVRSWGDSPNQSSGFSISGWWSWATGLMLVLIAGLFIIFCSVKSKE